MCVLTCLQIKIKSHGTLLLAFHVCRLFDLWISSRGSLLVSVIGTYLRNQNSHDIGDQYIIDGIGGIVIGLLYLATYLIDSIQQYMSGMREYVLGLSF